MIFSKNTRFFKGLSLFSSLTPPEIEGLEQLSHERRYEKDQFLFQEGDEAKGLLVIKDGYVKILKQAASGKNIIIRLSSSNDFMGEVAVFNKIPYPVSAQALVKTVTYEIPTENLLSFIQKYPNVIFKLIGMSLMKLAEAYTIIDGLGTKTLEQRIAVTLLNLAEKIGHMEGSHIELKVSISRQDLAEMVGCTKESACRVMANLKREGITVCSKRKIIIIAPDRLGAIVDEVEK